MAEIKRTLIEPNEARVAASKRAGNLSLVGAEGPPQDKIDVEVAYRETRTLIGRWLARFGVAKADVPDLTHDVFAVLLEYRGELHRGGSLHPVLHGISRNLASRYRRRRLPKRLAMSDPEFSPSADEVYDARDVQRLVRGAMASLASRRRRVLELLELGEWTYEEVAQHLDMKVDRLRLDRHRGRKELRLELERPRSLKRVP